jgi:CO/xanthine dehydrogenase Mo-binding subunit
MPTAFEHQSPPPGPTAHFVGSSVARKEDKRLLTGHGLYVDDVVLPGMLHAVFVRSELAKATITHLDTTEARRLPGVVAVFTWEDFDGRFTPLGPNDIHRLLIEAGVGRMSSRRARGALRFPP